jgi:hypothetical protein
LKLFNCLVNERGFDSSHARPKFGDAVLAQRFAFEGSDNERKKCFLESKEFSGQKARFWRQPNAGENLPAGKLGGANAKMPGTFGK